MTLEPNLKTFLTQGKTAKEIAISLHDMTGFTVAFSKDPSEALKRLENEKWIPLSLIEKTVEELQNLNFPAWYKAHKQEIIERFIPKRITTEKTIITDAEVVQFFVEHELGVPKK